MLRIYPKYGDLTFRPELKRLRAFPGGQYRTHVAKRIVGDMSRFRPRERPPKFFMGATDLEGRYIPTEDEIKPYPTPGAWYRFGTHKKGETYYGIAKRAYGGTGAQVQKGLVLINDATWNDHIDRKKRHWKPYRKLLKKTGGKGLQSTPDYDSFNNPKAGVLTGNNYPVMWIPPLSGEEPEEMGYADPIVTSPTPVPKPVPPPPPLPPAAEQIPGPPGPPGVPGAIGPPGPPPSSSAVQSAVDQWFQANPPPEAVSVPGPPGVPGAIGPPGPPPSSSAVQSAVDSYLIANPPPAGPPGPPGPPGGTVTTGEGDAKKLWALPLVAMMAALK